MPDLHHGKFVPIAFLLAQVGAGAARQFAKLLKPLQFAPYDAGILRLLSRSSGISQQYLARQLDMHASRLVGLIDALEQRRLVAREPNPTDRRVYSLRLTEQGQEALGAIGAAARAHNEAICACLTDTEREQLEATLEKIASTLGLRPGVHPGYRDLGKPTTDSAKASGTG
jgi:DNA-binding MarR family transcriptional regulator